MASTLDTPETRDSLKQIQQLEEAELVLLFEALEDARIEILGKIADSGLEKVHPVNVRPIVRKSEESIRKLARKARRNRARGIRRQFKESRHQVVAQIERFERTLRFPTGLKEKTIRKLVAQEGLLLQQYERSLATYGNQLVGDIQRRMVGHAVRGSTIREVQQDIAGRLEDSAIKQSRKRAELITRTEMADAWGVGHQESIREASEVVPELKQQWDALATACKVCAPLEGEIRPIGQVFTTYRGRAILRPTVHPRCNCRLLPYKDSWAAFLAEES